MIEQYISLVEMLGKIVPSNVEVVLHDVNNLTNSIVAIANGHVSGRKIGMSATDFTLEVLSDKKLQEHSVIDGYSTVSKTGRRLSSYTFLVKNEAKELVALLCFNVDDQLVSDSLETIAKLFSGQLSSLTNNGHQKNAIIENFFDDDKQLVNESAQAIIDAYGLPVSQMKSKHKVELVKIMNAKGIFLVKNSVKEVSELLDVSQATLYRYLNNIKKEN